MDPKYIDIHSHLQFAAFDNDREKVLERALESELWMINVGTQYDTSLAAVELAQNKDGVFATVGLHPIHTAKSYHDRQELGDGGAEFVSRGEEFNYEAYKKLALDPKVVGVGECGLDYYRLDGSTSLPQATLAKQKKIFEEHVRIANEVAKPLMLHIRNSPEGGSNAYRDALEIIKSVDPKIRGDVHFFAGAVDDARAFLDYGFTLSFTGAVTFPKAKKPGQADYEELIRFIPLDMILTETDCPYVAPAPHRGSRNEPANVRYVVGRIAKIKNLSEDEVAVTLVSNARRVFRL